MTHPQGLWFEERNDFMTRTRLKSLCTASSTIRACAEHTEAPIEQQLAVFACGEIATRQWPSPAFMESLAYGESTVLADSLWSRLEAELETVESEVDDDVPVINYLAEEQRFLEEQLGVRSRILQMKARIANFTEDVDEVSSGPNDALAREWLEHTGVQDLVAHEDDDITANDLLADLYLF